MRVVFLLLFKEIKLIYLISNYKIFLHLPEIKSGADQVYGMGLFVKIVNRSRWFLFLQEVLSWVFEYARCQCQPLLSH